MPNNCKRLAVLTFVSVSVIAAAVLGAGPFIPASAIHNEHGHEDKESLGECQRFTGEKEVCQSHKEDFKENRKD
jgi:hypothetical protein